MSVQGERFEMRVSERWLAELDRVRGHVPRAAFVKALVTHACGELPDMPAEESKRALEAALADDTPRPSPAGRQAKSEAAPRAAQPPAASRQGALRPPASPRTSEKPVEDRRRCSAGCSLASTFSGKRCLRHGLELA